MATLEFGLYLKDNKTIHLRVEALHLYNLKHIANHAVLQPLFVMKDGREILFGQQFTLPIIDPISDNIRIGDHLTVAIANIGKEE